MLSKEPALLAFFHCFLGCFFVTRAFIFQSKRKVFRDLIGVYWISLGLPITDLIFYFISETAREEADDYYFWAELPLSASVDTDLAALYSEFISIYLEFNLQEHCCY